MPSINNVDYNGLTMKMTFLFVCEVRKCIGVDEISYKKPVD